MIVGMVAIIVIGVYAFTGGGNDAGTTLTVRATDFHKQVSVSGTVVAAQDAELGFAASGRISSVYAQVGDRVGAGALIAETENGDLVAVLTQKQAALKKAEADLSTLRAGTRPEELAVSETVVANAETSLVSAVKNAYTVIDDAVHNKADTLFTNPRTNPYLNFTVSNASLKGIVEADREAVEDVLTSWKSVIANISVASVADAAATSQAYIAQVTTLLADANAALNQGVPDQDVSAATLATYATTLATARSNVSTVSSTLTTDQNTLLKARRNLELAQAGTRPETVVAQEAAVASAAAEVKNASAALTKTRVVAPFNGTVTRMDAKVGEVVSPSDKYIAIQSSGAFQIETFVSEVSISGVSVGNPATTTLDAYGSSVTFPARVIAVDPSETEKDGVPTYKTTLEFLTRDPRVRSGMTANVLIGTGILHDAIVIPTGAIALNAGDPFVSVVVGKNIERRSVTLGESPSLGFTHVLSGLVDGDIILLSPVR